MLLSLLTGGAATPIRAQGPPSSSREWRTLESEGYLVHFLPLAERYARAVAARLPEVRARVRDLVGSSPSDTVQFVVTAPATETEPGVLPFHDSPALASSGTPPDAGLLVGPFSDWISRDLFQRHVALSHLVRRPASWWLKSAQRILPVSPFALRSPPWVTTAYPETGTATVFGDQPLQQVLTGQLLASGRWPSFQEIADVGEVWPGLDGTEVVGVSFLRYLEGRMPGRTLGELWARMGSEGSSFEEAIREVTGSPLPRLYESATRELQKAADRARRPIDGTPLAEGLSALSAQRGPGGRWIVETFGGLRGRTLQVVLEGRVTARLPLPSRGGTAGPRWLPDGSILFTQAMREAQGIRRNELMRWVPQQGLVEQITREGDLSGADPLPRGGEVVAMRHRGGVSTLVRTDLVTGSSRTLVEWPVDQLAGHPRVSPDGERVAFLLHDGKGRWHLVVYHQSEDRLQRLPGDGFPVLAWPEWSDDGTRILTVAGTRREFGLARWDLEGGPPRFRPLPGIPVATGWDGETAMTVVNPFSGGARIVFVESFPARPAPAIEAPVWPVTTPATEEARPYGLGPREASSIYSGMYAPSGRVYTGGYRYGDLLGGWEVFAIAALSQAGEESGGLISGAWRKWRIPLEVHSYRIERRPSRQPESVPGLGRSLDATEMGVAVGTSWRRSRARRDLTGALFVKAGRRERPDRRRSAENYTLSIDLGGEWNNRPNSRASVGGSLDLRGAAGRREDDDWYATGAAIGGHLLLGDTWKLGLRWRRDRVWDAPTELDRFALGGVPSSLLPARLDFSRIYEPALPVGTLLGDRYERARLEIGFLDWPLRITFDRHRMADSDGSWGDSLRVVGMELSLDRGIRPLYRHPSSSIRVGTAYILDAPFEDDLAAWAGIAWSV
ncbi:MAG: hypothetical protein R3234_04605 [Thermoanaerobaculia bacterium]|nr:hypothetical protein [Thermoanaerobaculia bacterium]